MVIGTKFTHGGHIVCIIGFDDDKGCFLVNDPYGNPLDNYKEKLDGKEEWIPYDFKKWQRKFNPATTRSHCLLVKRDY